jgi:hypothetical protein
MDIKPIKTEEHYKKYLSRMNEIFYAEYDTTEDKEWIC